jgi:hypothetical protein
MTTEKKCKTCKHKDKTIDLYCIKCKDYCCWENDKPKIDDGGSRQEFSTGAVREQQTGKGRFDLITPEGLFRLAKWYELGAQKYVDRNWEHGLPISNCLNSMFRHLVKYMAGWDDEDHLAAICWNAFAIMHFEKYKPELMNIPLRMTEKEETQ